MFVSRVTFNNWQEKSATGVRSVSKGAFSCHFISNVETGKITAADTKQDILLKSIEKLNPENPLTMLIDYVRIRFPAMDIRCVIEGLMHIKMMYMLHEDYGFYSYDEQYSRGDIVVLVSHDEKKGILLELKGKGCRQLEGCLEAQRRSWYEFLQDALNMGGIMKRIDLAINDCNGILDIGKLTQKCENEECISVFRSFKSVPPAKPVVCFPPYKGSFPALESKDSSKGSPAATSVTC